MYIIGYALVIGLCRMHYFDLTPFGPGKPGSPIFPPSPSGPCGPRAPRNPRCPLGQSDDVLGKPLYIDIAERLVF